MTALQDLNTLKKGFAKLHEKHAQSTAKNSALEDQRDGFRDESVQLKAQVATLQEGLVAQTEKATSATEALRVRITILTLHSEFSH